MTTLPGEHHDIGRIVNTPEEFKSWVRENMATLIRSGRWFDKDAYKEILKFLKKTKRVCAIIPEDDVAVMETHLNRFMRVFEEQGHTVLRNRTLFDGIQILVGDSDDIEEVTPLKATARPHQCRRRSQRHQAWKRVFVRKTKWRFIRCCWKE